MTARIAWYPEIRSDVHFRVYVGVCRDASYRLVLRSALTNPLTSPGFPEGDNEHR